MFKKAFLLIILASPLLLAGCSSNSSKAHSATPEEVAQEESVQYIPASYQAYSKAAFDQAVADGKTVFAEFHADWCIICKTKEPSIQAAFEAIDDPNIVGFKVNFDTEIELKRQLGVYAQTTSVLLKNGEVIKRLGPNTRDGILEFIQG